MNNTPHQKNIVYGNIHANGNVHIGDIIYNIATDFQSGSILFLRLDKAEDNQYVANLSIKSKHSTQGTLATSGEKWCENIEVNILPQLFDDLAEFQTFRRSIDTQTRYKGIGRPDNPSIQAIENNLAQRIFQAFFAGDIGKACTDFIQLLEEQRIDELLLAISADDETLINLPFEMVLPLLFPPKLGEAKKSLAINNFGLVRTKIASLEAFKMQGDHATAAPLKMLFITALPENLDERGKMLQIEEEQTRLIQSIGALEATGDKQPKIVIEFLENASLAELDKALKARQHDIVHISGHGAYHAAENKGVLYFENEDGDEEQVSGAALGETLRQHACVKLLILSACETAIAGSEGGVTEQAAAFGVPSIVAMRFAVTDEGAKVFTTEFYTQLAKGLSLTRALAYAREALHQDIVQRREQSPQILHIAEWFTPVVYQNQSVGALIDTTQPYHLPDNFYPLSSFLKTKQSRLIGEGFIGRKRYLIQMRQAFRAGRHICLHGLGGLGKTTLAEAFAHNYDNHSHVTIIFRNGNQINEAHILNTLNKRFAKINPDLAEQLQQAIDDPQTDVLDKLQLLIDNYLNGRKTILIFDNVEDVQMDEGGAYQRNIDSESLSAFLRHLCENTPTNCHILFTTRYKIENLADVVEHLALDKMGYAEQYRLLNYSPILRGIPLQERDDVYKRLDGHPRGYEYLEALLKHDKTFSWQQVSKAEADVFENLLLAKVYDRLTAQEKAIFQMVSVFIARTPLAALAAVSGEKGADLLPVLKALQDWSLCFLEKDGRFEVHRLTREWTKKSLVNDEKEKEYSNIIGYYYKNLVDKNGNLTFEDADLSKNYFSIAENWNEFAGLSMMIQGTYQVFGYYEKAIELNQVVIDKNIDSNITINALNYQGLTLCSIGFYEKALDCLNQALLLSREMHNIEGEGGALSNIGQVFYGQGNLDLALKYWLESYELIENINNYDVKSTKLNNIGQGYFAKGEYKTAIEYFEKSKNVLESFLMNDELTYGSSMAHLLTKKATILSNIGQIYYSIGKYDEALENLNASLNIINNEVGSRKILGTVLNNIGLVCYYKKEYSVALNHFENCLQTVQEIGDKYTEGLILNNIGLVYSDLDEDTKALEYWELSLELIKQIGAKQIEATTLNNIGQTYTKLGNPKLGLSYLEQGLKIHKQNNDLNGIATTKHNIGFSKFELNQVEESMYYLVPSYWAFQKLNSPLLKASEYYLNKVFDIIGEVRFSEIITEIQSHTEGE